MKFLNILAVFTTLPLGATISSFPVSPRFGRILSLSSQRGLLNYAIALVAACTVREMINHNNDKIKALKQLWTDSAKVILGDLLVSLSAIGSTESSKDPQNFAIDAVFYRTYPLLYHKFGTMVIFRPGSLYSLCSPGNQHY